MKTPFLYLLLCLLATPLTYSIEIFSDDFSSYTNGASIAGVDWDPKYDTVTDLTQQDLLTGHTDGYAVLNTSVAKLNYHAPTKHGFIVGTNGGGTAVVTTDFRFLYAGGGNITTNKNKAAFGILLSTTSNWEDGTNSGVPVVNRDDAIGTLLPFNPWVEGWITNSTIGLDTSTNDLSDWLTLELTLTDISGSLWVQVTITNKDTSTLLYTSTQYDTGLSSSETIYAGISTHWSNQSGSVASFSRYDEVHIDNFNVEVFSTPIDVTISPEISAAIGGELDLNRSQFFGLSTTGQNFESTINDSNQVDYYTDTLGIKLGRELGGVYTKNRYNSSAIRELGTTGTVDIPYFIANITSSNGNSTQAFRNKFGANQDVATHDRTDAYPSFMTMWGDGNTNGEHFYPTDVTAAAKFAAAVLEYGYTDWTRPTTYEIVNEPNYRIWDDQRFANLHTAVKAEVDSAGLNVDVGGPCMAVAYFYKNNYQYDGLMEFIDNTSCGLDFYSFHAYDFMSWDAAAHDFNGRVTTGLPIEGVLDVVQNYTVNNYSKEVEIVLTEHGGYISNDEETALDTIANTYFPGTGFAYEMKRRSVSEFLAVSSAIANTMAFMNNPHVVRKAVPFILLESAAWDPRYYSTLLVKENFDANSNVWHESKYVNFYKFFKNVTGRRVKVQLHDPDIQTQAYVDGNKLYILLNNLANKPEGLNLNVPTSDINQMTLRRLGRNADFTPYFTETIVASLTGLNIGAREAIAIEVEYNSVIAQQALVDEVPYYGNLVQQAFTGSKTFSVSVPEYQNAQYATLRLGISRGTGTDRDVNVTFNGSPLTVPMEDCAAYLEGGSEYGSTKLISIPTNILQASNTIEVSFPGGGSGGIGSVVLRAAIATNQAPTVDAGDDQNLETPNNTITLSGSVLDDSLPNGSPLTSQWTQVEGPMDAEIDSPTAATTTGTLPIEGTYVFRLTASDTVYQTSDNISIILSEPAGEAAPDADLDADGMLDSWEKAHFGSILLKDGSENQDLDDFNDLYESIAGTDPKDAQSFLKVTLSEDVANPGQLKLEWQPVAGRQYTIHHTSDLNTSFQPLHRGLTPPQSSINITPSASPSTGFYQIEVQLDVAP